MIVQIIVGEGVGREGVGQRKHGTRSAEKRIGKRHEEGKKSLMAMADNRRR